MERVTLKPSGIMVEYENKRKHRELTDYEKDLLSINKAYESENYDVYEQRIYRATAKFKKPYYQVEDDATDIRLFGIDGN